MNISTTPDLRSLFPFKLDDFQEEAIAALNAGESVVVCAPTGSGKTLIGEYAIHRALAKGKRVFYTTPLKALSNQKLRDFRDEFGADRVGLLTGDLSLNRDAPIIVMTTEIFRNMLYGTPIGQVGTSVIDVEAVVLDECHYMNDRQRGTVWEESIIYAPPGIQLVALSATIANSDQLTDWIDRVHGPTKLIYSDFRPVPLQFHFCNPKGLFPLLNDSQKAINPRLKPKGGKPRGRQEAPYIEFVLGQLQQRDMLPAIYFIFSRRGCDRAVENLSHLTLVNDREAATLKEQIDAFLERNPEAGRVGHIESLYRGIASHHAGVLPAWKGLIEELFQQGLIKVVFATETLAAGINMPARTTVISSLSKRTDRGHRLLNASEFLQMAGRAGRRGMDLLGHVVTVQTPYEGATEAAYLATSKADPLVSQFTPSYGMVLNLLQTHSIEEAQNLVERSFGHYLATLHLKPQQQGINDLIAEIELQRSQIKELNADLVAQYEKLSDRLREERRLLKTLQHQAMEMQADQVAMAVAFAVSGTLLTLKTKQMSVPLPATLVMKVPGSGQFPYLVCLGQDNRWYVVAVSDVIGLHAEYPRLSQVDRLTPPEDLPPKVGSIKRSDENTLAIVRQIPVVDLEQDAAPEVEEQQARVTAIEEQMQNHPLRKLGDPGYLIKRQKRIWKLEEELESRKSKFAQYSQRYWQEFLNLMEVLGHFGCLANNKPTPLGQVAAAIRGDNELWLGLALASGELDRLEPHHLAAVCAALVTEVSRPDNWTRYEPSGEIGEALSEVWSVRRELLKLQRRYQIAFPAWLESDWIGLIEQWALGIEWQELCSHTTLDEGDVVRILRRTVDFLSQVPHVPYIADELKQNARRAIQLIDRFPVNEATD
ncbi:DEAD/DEAH box helicase [Leptolyngbya sp. FACHB-711]|uniref:DEAD/DEAH box helicase n=1 Tax=unclassified Leptolyngbya TaxID=2650499 RepID=UPI001689907C|nr:DEAD/DEAH box helicase [Cyanobacteria bacterium FACHB-502]MBD2026119.1 DEAD/DEAH box helicase [Leptolyngbya sp. FACHB-711]